MGSKYLLSALLVLLPALTARGDTRGGWPDQAWTYIFEGDGDFSGPLGTFTDLDGTWDSQNPFNMWFSDTIINTTQIGGVESFWRSGLGDNEHGYSWPDARTLSLFDYGNNQGNSMLFFERMMTSADNAGGGAPLIDFGHDLTAICRFRFFTIDDLNADAALRRGLGIPAEEDDTLASVTTENAGRNEYDEGPREMEGSPCGMFMVTRGDVHEGLGGSAGGLYWGVGVDGDDSWDPSTFTIPPPPAAHVGVKVAFIVRGPFNTNATYQMSDARIVDRLRARGIEVTVLDNGAGTPLTGGHMSYVSVTNPALTGPAAVAADHDLVVISSTVGSNNVSNANGYHPYNVPVIMWENGLGNPAKGYGIADQGGIVAEGTHLQILDNTHPITAGLPLDTVQIIAGATPRRMSLVGYTPPPCGVLLACWPGATVYNAVVAYDPAIGGGKLWVSPPLQSNQRWVFLPLEDDTFWALNQAGMSIFDGAVEWALGPSKAALLAARPPLAPAPPGPAAWRPSFYINLGATPVIPATGHAINTRVLQGRFFRDLANPDPAAPRVGGDTRVWADLPTGSMRDFVSVLVTISPEQSPPPGPLPACRVKVFFNGSTTPAIEIQNHHLDPSIVSAVANNSPNDGTGLAMGNWRPRAAGFLEVDYFGIRDPASPPARCRILSQDVNRDGDVDVDDFIVFQSCFRGPAIPYPAGLDHVACRCLDADQDGDVDLADFGVFQQCFNGQGQPPGCSR